MKRFKGLGKSGVFRAVASGAILFGVVFVLLPGASRASAAVPGFTAPPPIAVNSTNESCGSYLVGMHTPKVALTVNTPPPVIFQAGATIPYTFSQTPADTANYNIRVCVTEADINGNFVATLGEAEFDNIPVPPDGGGFNFTFQLPNPLPGTIGNAPGDAYQVCSVAKTQQSVNGGGADRKSVPQCNVIQVPTTTNTIVKDASGNPVTTAQPLGTVVHDTATLGGALSNAGGTVSYQLLSNGTCDTTLPANTIRTDTVNVTNDVVPDDIPPPDKGFKAPSAGSYSFLVTYSGDIEDLGSTAKCEPFTITAITPTLVTTPSPTGTVPPGTPVADQAAVEGNAAGGAVSGTATFSCTLSGTATPCTAANPFSTKNSGTSPAGSPDTTVYTSDQVNTAGSPLADGTYCFSATFTSTSANYTDQSKETETSPSQECFTVATPGRDTTKTATTLQNAPGVAGSTMTDQATVTDTTTPGPATAGNVDFLLFTSTSPLSGTNAAGAPITCDGQAGVTGNTLVSSETVSGGGVATSLATNALPAGDYGFEAVYGGSLTPAPGFKSSTSACEPFSIAKADTATGTTLVPPKDAIPGSIFSDSAAVTLPGGGALPFQPNGTVTFTLYSASSAFNNAADCAGQPGAAAKFSSSAVPISSTGTAAFTATTKLGAGNYGYQATYTPTGDPNFNGSTSVCEPFTIAAPVTSIQTSPTGDGATGPASSTDSATVTPTAPASFSSQAATGTVTFTLYSAGSAFKSTVACTDRTQPASTVVTAAQNVAATAAGTASSNATNNLAAGNYGWQVSYSNDPNYQNSTGNCEPFQVIAAAVAPAAGPSPASVTGVKSSNPPNGSVVGPGDTVVYTITLSNSGQTDATSVTVTDVVPNGTTFVSATSGGTDNSGTVTWSGLTVPAGGNTSVTFTVKVNSDDSGITIPNQAQFTNVNDPGCTTPTCPTNVVTLTVPKQPVMTAPASATTTTTTTTTVAPTTTTLKPVLAFTGAYTDRLVVAGTAAVITGFIVLTFSRRRPKPTYAHQRNDRPGRSW